MWALVSLGAGFIAWPAATWLACTTFVLGVVSGNLQAIALRQSAEAFRAAKTALQVRQAMAATTSGKLSIALLWGAVAVAVVWAFAGKGGNPLAVLLSGYASFALARELFSFTAVRQLAQAA